MRISIEGLPGSGKTTILQLLSDMGYNCYYNDDTELLLLEAEAEETPEATEATGATEATEATEVTEATAATAIKEVATTAETTEEIEVQLKLIENSPYLIKALYKALSNHYLRYPPLKGAELFNKNNDWMPDYIIYLDCHPDIVIKRLPADYYLTSIQITELYSMFDLILHPVNCNIPVFKVNASGTVLATLHHILEAIKYIKTMLL
jgi:dephospho-CoA kinase